MRNLSHHPSQNISTETVYRILLYRYDAARILVSKKKIREQFLARHYCSRTRTFRSYLQQVETSCIKLRKKKITKLHSRSKKISKETKRLFRMILPRRSGLTTFPISITKEVISCVGVCRKVRVNTFLSFSCQPVSFLHKIIDENPDVVYYVSDKMLVVLGLILVLKIDSIPHGGHSTLKRLQTTLCLKTMSNSTSQLILVICNSHTVIHLSASMGANRPTPHHPSLSPTYDGKPGTPIHDVTGSFNERKAIWSRRQSHELSPARGAAYRIRHK